MNIARLKQSRAFTLIELIVVIVILGILVAIGAFAYNNIIDGTRQDAASKTAGQVGKDIQAASSLNQGPILGAAAPAAVVTAVAPGAPSGTSLLSNGTTASPTPWTGDYTDNIYYRTAATAGPPATGPVFTIKNASGKCADIKFSANTVGASFTVVNNLTCG